MAFEKDSPSIKKVDRNLIEVEPIHPGDPVVPMNALRLENALTPGDPAINDSAQSLVEWALESSPVATLFIAPDETILRWNQKAAENLIPARFRKPSGFSP